MDTLLEFDDGSSGSEFGVAFQFNVKSEEILLLDILDFGFLVVFSFFFSGPHGKIRPEWLNIQGCLNEFLFFNALDNRGKVVQHIVVIDFFIFESFYAFQHN